MRADDVYNTGGDHSLNDGFYEAAPRHTVIRKASLSVSSRAVFGSSRTLAQALVNSRQPTWPFMGSCRFPSAVATLQATCEVEQNVSGPKRYRVGLEAPRRLRTVNAVAAATPWRIVARAGRIARRAKRIEAKAAQRGWQKLVVERRGVRSGGEREAGDGTSRDRLEVTRLLASSVSGDDVFVPGGPARRY